MKRHRYPTLRAVDARGKRYRVCLFCGFAYVATQAKFLAHAGSRVRKFGRFIPVQEHWHYCWRSCTDAACIEQRERWDARRRERGATA